MIAIAIVISTVRVIAICVIADILTLVITVLAVARVVDIATVQQQF